MYTNEPSVNTAELSDAKKLSVIGTTEPFLDVTLSAPTPGIIGARLCAEGDFVEEGKVLVEQRKRLEELDVERRQIALETAKMDYESTRELYDRTRSVSRDEMVTKESTYKVAQADLAIAQQGGAGN